MQRTQRSLSMPPRFISMHPEGHTFTQHPHFTHFPVIASLKTWGNDFQSSRTLTVFWSILFALVFADAIFWRLFSIHLRKR